MNKRALVALVATLVAVARGITLPSVTAGQENGMVMTAITTKASARKISTCSTYTWAISPNAAYYVDASSEGSCFSEDRYDEYDVSVTVRSSNPVDTYVVYYGEQYCYSDRTSWDNYYYGYESFTGSSQYVRKWGPYAPEVSQYMPKVIYFCTNYWSNCDMTTTTCFTIYDSGSSGDDDDYYGSSSDAWVIGVAVGAVVLFIVIVVSAVLIAKRKKQARVRGTKVATTDADESTPRDAPYVAFNDSRSALATSSSKHMSLPGPASTPSTTYSAYSTNQAYSSGPYGVPPHQFGYPPQQQFGYGQPASLHPPIPPGPTNTYAEAHPPPASFGAPMHQRPAEEQQRGAPQDSATAPLLASNDAL